MRYLLILIISILLCGCSCIDTKIPLEGNLGPYHLKTTVDSEIARYYVENYLAAKKTNSELDFRIDSLSMQFRNRVPQREDLKMIAKDFSVDFAALFWAQRILERAEDQAIQKVFLKNLNDTSLLLAASLKDYKILLVPGLDYKKNGYLTGADLKTQIELFSNAGATVQFIEIPPLGTVEENSLVITEAIKKNADQKILLAGPSSAGPAIHLALAKNLSVQESRHVAVWLNLGGVINGSPVIDWIDSGMTYPFWSAILWFKDWDRKTYQSLRADISRQRATGLTVPEHIKIINYVGLSLSGNISKFAEDKYCIMRSEGPNDGLGLLPDMIVPNSQTIIAPTSDHFFAEDPQIKEKSMALLKTVIDVLR